MEFSDFEIRGKFSDRAKSSLALLANYLDIRTSKPGKLIAQQYEPHLIRIEPQSGQRIERVCLTPEHVENNSLKFRVATDTNVTVEMSPIVYAIHF